MNINQLSNTMGIANYAKQNNLSRNMKHNEVSFQAASGLKKLMVTAPLALATMGIAVNANAQTAENVNSTEITAADSADASRRVLLPNLHMGDYFVEHGFNPEQRAAIANYAEGYAEKHMKSVMEAAMDADAKCSMNTMICDFPPNPYGLFLDHFMGKAQQYCKDLTEYRNTMILLGFIRNENGGYVENPTLDPIEDNKEKIEEVLGEGVTYQQYTEDNAETIKKLDNIKFEDLLSLPKDEQKVYANMRKIISIASNYASEKRKEYTEEASEAVDKVTNTFVNDMNNLDIFRNETDNLKNTFITKTYDGSSITIDREKFGYWATREGFMQAAVEEYAKVLAAQTGIDAPKVNREESAYGKGLTYDLSGRVVSGNSKGIHIINGKKVFVK